MKTFKLLFIAGIALVLANHPIACQMATKNAEGQKGPAYSAVTESRQDPAVSEETPESSVPSTENDTVKADASVPETESIEPASDEKETVEPSGETDEESSRASDSEETLSEGSVSEAPSSEDKKTSTEAPTTVSPTVAPTTVPTEPSLSQPSATAPATAPTTAPITPSTIAQCREHNFDYSVVVEPTCTKEGVMALTCTVCGYVYQGPIEKTEHTWNSGAVTTPATCSKDGVKTYTCSGCGKTRTEAIPATGDHHYTATKTVPQTRIGTMADLGYTVYTCSGCGASYNGDYEGYLDCAWRYQKVNEYRTGAGRSLLLEDGSKVYFNIEGCTQLAPFTRAEGLENIAMLRAKQEAYDIHNGERLNHEHNGFPAGYYYGTSFWGGLNCECCQYGGDGLDATFREEENASYASQGHLRIVLNSSLKYIGIAAYVKDGGVVIVCEYSDIPK